MFDPRTERITEWEGADAVEPPYDAVPAATASVDGSMLTDACRDSTSRAGVQEIHAARPTNIRRVYRRFEEPARSGSAATTRIHRQGRTGRLADEIDRPTSPRSCASNGRGWSRARDLCSEGRVTVDASGVSTRLARSSRRSGGRRRTARPSSVPAPCPRAHRVLRPRRGRRRQAAGI